MEIVRCRPSTTSAVTWRKVVGYLSTKRRFGTENNAKVLQSIEKDELAKPTHVERKDEVIFLQPATRYIVYKIERYIALSQRVKRYDLSLIHKVYH
jgi:hypothetical protein